LTGSQQLPLFKKSIRFSVWHRPITGKEVKALVTLRFNQPVGQLIHRIIEHLVPEANAFRVIPVAAVIDIPDSGPQNGAQAHGAGFRSGIDVRAFQVKAADVFARVTYCFHFAVTSWILVLDYAIVSSSDDFAIAHHNRAERAAMAVFDANLRLLDCLIHEGILHQNRLPLTTLR
jgi:hypothetical protein